MNVVYLAADDPLYLPAFFDRVLAARPDTSAVFVVPPLYRNQSRLGAGWRYSRTFGAAATVWLAAQTLRAAMRRQSVARVSERHGIPCEAIHDVNEPSFLARLRAMGTDLIVSVSCPQIFKTPLIQLPRLGCLNIHGAILPNYRGVMPSFWMLANREERAGVSIFYVNEQIDAGDLCGLRVFEIRDGETLDEFLRRSKTIAAELLLDVLAEIEAGRVTRVPLDLSEGSYYAWPDRDAVRRFHAAGRKLW